MERSIFVKVLLEVAGAAVSAGTGILAVGESAPITVTAIGAVLGFATLLVRSVLKTQKVYVDIVATKDTEIAARDDTIHYLRWENESIRFRAGQREVDPGPYTPRRATVTLPAPAPQEKPA